MNRNVDLAPFEAIVLDVPANVRIRIGERESARINAEQKVIDSIRFTVSGKTLTVSVAGSFQTQESVTIEITCRQLVSLRASSSVDAKVGSLAGKRFELKTEDAASVEMEKLNLSSLRADISGSATVRVAGEATSQQVKVAGSGSYDAGELRSETARVSATDSSDAVIDIRDSLDVDVSGAATVQYAGKPKLKQSVSDAGTLERRE